MTDGGYDKVRSRSKSTEEQNAVTTARIKQIQSQLDSSVRAGKLKGKVCIVTGVGSLKGIGWIPLKFQIYRTLTLNPSRATSILFAHEGELGISSFLRFSTFSGAKHLYLLDFDPTNLPELKSTIEKKYPDVKVGIQPLIVNLMLIDFVEGHYDASRRCRWNRHLRCVWSGSPRRRKARRLLCQRKEDSSLSVALISIC